MEARREGGGVAVDVGVRLRAPHAGILVGLVSDEPCVDIVVPYARLVPYVGRGGGVPHSFCSARRVAASCGCFDLDLCPPLPSEGQRVVRP